MLIYLHLFLQNDKAMQFLVEIGPDALINTFVVNVKNDDGTVNTNLDVANALQNDIFQELSGCVGRTTKRILMFLTTSNFSSKKYGKALDDFKKRLGVCNLCTSSICICDTCIFTLFYP